MPLKLIVGRQGFSLGSSYSRQKKYPGLKANPTTALFRGMNAPAPSANKSPRKDSGSACDGWKENPALPAMAGKRIRR
jgi:hypothetical protein